MLKLIQNNTLGNNLTNNINCSKTQLKIVQPVFTGETDKAEFSNTKSNTAKNKKSLKEMLMSLLESILSVFRQETSSEKVANAEPIDIKDASKKLKKASQLMNDFATILEEDQKRSTPVFKDIKEGTLQKIFQLALRNQDKPALLGIVGGSASGKSTISKQFVKNINELAPPNNNGVPLISEISQDNFYYNFSKEIEKMGSEEFFKTKNLNEPKAVELDLLAEKLATLKQGKEIKTPHYLIDGTGRREDDAITVKPSPLVTVEGLLILANKKVRDLFDLRIFIDASKEVRTKRWWDRAPDRNIKDDAGGRALFKMTMDMHDKHVERYKPTADIVLNSEAKFDDTKTVLKQLAEAITKPVSFAGLFKKKAA
ncbi:MAG: hypothetical protein AB1782_15280 [Cyanobacteriota bacterium]